MEDPVRDAWLRAVERVSACRNGGAFLYSPANDVLVGTRGFWVCAFARNLDEVTRKRARVTSLGDLASMLVNDDPTRNILTAGLIDLCAGKISHLTVPVDFGDSRVSLSASGDVATGTAVVELAPGPCTCGPLIVPMSEVFVAGAVRRTSSAYAAASSTDGINLPRGPNAVPVPQPASGAGGGDTKQMPGSANEGLQLGQVCSKCGVLGVIRLVGSLDRADVLFCGAGASPECSPADRRPSESLPLGSHLPTDMRVPPSGLETSFPHTSTKDSAFSTQLPPSARRPLCRPGSAAAAAAGVSSFQMPDQGHVRAGPDGRFWSEAEAITADAEVADINGALCDSTAPSLNTGKTGDKNSMPDAVEQGPSVTTSASQFPGECGGREFRQAHAANTLHRTRSRPLPNPCKRTGGLVEAEDVAGFGRWEVNLRDGGLTWSAGMFALFGRSHWDEPPKCFARMLAYLDPIDAMKLSALAATALERGTGHLCDVRIPLACGRERVLLMRGYIVRDGHSQTPVQWHGYAQDVTNIRVLRDRLVLTKRLLRHAQVMANVGTWVYMPETDSIMWTKEVHVMHGIHVEDVRSSSSHSVSSVCEQEVDAAQMLWSDRCDALSDIKFERLSSTPASLDAYTELVHPDDRSSFMQHIYYPLKCGAPRFEHTYRVLVKEDGVAKTRHLYVRGECARQDGRLTATGFVQDVTERAMPLLLRSASDEALDDKVRTSIACLHGLVDLLRSSQLTTEQYDDLDLLSVALRDLVGHVIY